MLTQTPPNCSEGDYSPVTVEFYQTAIHVHCMLATSVEADIDQIRAPGLQNIFLPKHLAGLANEPSAADEVRTPVALGVIEDGNDRGGHVDGIGSILKHDSPPHPPTGNHPEPEVSKRSNPDKNHGLGCVGVQSCHAICSHHSLVCTY